MTKLSNGSRLQHGQLINARVGAPKNAVATIPIAHGMKRQTSGSLHPYLHGQSINDEPNEKRFLNGKGVPIHSGMVSKTIAQRGTDKGPDHGSAMLQDACHLGRPKD